MSSVEGDLSLGAGKASPHLLKHRRRDGHVEGLRGTIIVTPAFVGTERDIYFRILDLGQTGKNLKTPQ